jgi:hypothetical protein
MATAGQVESVRRDIERVCQLLTAPSVENLNGSAQILEMAVSRLQLDRAAPNSHASILPEWRNLRASLGRATKLLNSAMDYRTRWNQRLGAMAGGYTAEGRSAELPARPRMWVMG